MFIHFMILISLQIGSYSSSWSKAINEVDIEVQKNSGTIKISNENNTLEIQYKNIIELAENGVIQVGVSPKTTLKH